MAFLPFGVLLLIMRPPLNLFLGTRRRQLANLLAEENRLISFAFEGVGSAVGEMMASTRIFSTYIGQISSLLFFRACSRSRSRASFPNGSGTVTGPDEPFAGVITIKESIDDASTAAESLLNLTMLSDRSTPK